MANNGLLHKGESEFDHECFQSSSKIIGLDTLEEEVVKEIDGRVSANKYIHQYQRGNIQSCEKGWCIRGLSLPLEKVTLLIPKSRKDPWYSEKLLL